jgi:prevent-host-death family protein
MTLKTMEASEVRKNFAEVTHRIAYGNERVIIAKHGKPVVAMVSVPDLELLERLEEEAEARIARDRIADLDAGRAETVTFEEALAELNLK